MTRGSLLLSTSYVEKTLVHKVVSNWASYSLENTILTSPSRHWCSFPALQCSLRESVYETKPFYWMLHNLNGKNRTYTSPQDQTIGIHPRTFSRVKPDYWLPISARNIFIHLHSVYLRQMTASEHWSTSPPYSRSLWEPVCRDIVTDNIKENNEGLHSDVRCTGAVMDYSQRRTTSSIKVKWYSGYPGVTIIQRNFMSK